MDKCSVAVIIATHNYGHYLKDAINSVIRQDYDGEITIVVVDDASTDDTRKSFIEGNVVDVGFENVPESKVQNIIDSGTILSFCRPSSRPDIGIYFTSLQKNSGPSIARNVALRIAQEKVQPDVVAFLDADDMMVKSKLSRLVPILQQSNVGLIYADYYHLYPDGRCSIELKEIFSIERFMNENIGPNNTSVLKMKALEDVVDENGDFFDPVMRTCEDYDLFLRVAENVAIKHIAEPLSFLRIHQDNSTSTVENSTWVKDRTRVNQKLMERMNVKHKTSIKRN